MRKISEDSKQDNFLKVEKSPPMNPNNKGRPNINIIKVKAFDNEPTPKKKPRPNSVSIQALQARRRFSANKSISTDSFFSQEEISEAVNQNDKGHHRKPIKRQSTLGKDKDTLYPTIDELESKEESMGQTSSEEESKNMKEIFYKNKPKELKIKENIPKKTINTRFRSRMFNLFD